MNLEQKIGAMLAYGWAGANREEETTVNSHAREIVEEMQVGAICLLPRNVADDLAVTTNTLNELQAMSREPLLMIVDQEGGMVARFVDGFSQFPSNMALGATGSPELAYKAAAVTAAELKAVGVNYNFAPCVDVNNNPDNPIIGTRSYGESSDRVAEYTVQAVRGYQDTGVIACAKHFPGHGDTSVDSHLELPSVPYPRERLDEIELKPFRAAIAAGISSIMTTHIMFPVFDTQFPATLSKNILTGLLRNELGFEGVIVTDCREMKAIAHNFGSAESAVLAIEAGVDLLLVAHTLSTQREMREALIKAVKDGRIPESRIDESVRRITELKHKYDLSNRRFADPEALGKVLRCKEHVALQEEIADRAATLVRNDDGAVPLKLSPGQSVLVMGLHGTVTQLACAAREHCDNVEALQLQGEAADVLPRAMEAAARADVVIVPTCPHEPWRAKVDQELQVRLVKALAAEAKRLIVVAVREPYDLRNFPEVGTYICTYGYRGSSLDSAIALMFGKIEPRGALPVTIPECTSAVRKAPNSGVTIQEYF